MQLKMRTDSLERAISTRDRYLQNLKDVIGGNIQLDTTQLKVPTVENSTY